MVDERTVYMLPGENWRSYFDEHKQRLIDNCQVYAQNDPAGMPGHVLALIIADFASLLDGDVDESRWPSVRPFPNVPPRPRVQPNRDSTE